MQFDKSNAGNILPKCLGVVPRNFKTFLFKYQTKQLIQGIDKELLIVLERNKDIEKDWDFNFLLLLWLSIPLFCY